VIDENRLRKLSQIFAVEVDMTVESPGAQFQLRGRENHFTVTVSSLRKLFRLIGSIRQRGFTIYQLWKIRTMLRKADIHLKLNVERTFSLPIA